MWDSASIMAKGHAVNAFITRAAPELILKRMEVMGFYSYARENNSVSTNKCAMIAHEFEGGREQRPPVQSGRWAAEAICDLLGLESKRY